MVTDEAPEEPSGFPWGIVLAAGGVAAAVAVWAYRR
jgi:hypothetical protein